MSSWRGREQRRRHANKHPDVEYGFSASRFYPAKKGYASGGVYFFWKKKIGIGRDHFIHCNIFMVLCWHFFQFSEHCFFIIWISGFVYVPWILLFLKDSHLALFKTGGNLSWGKKIGIILIFNFYSLIKRWKNAEQKFYSMAGKSKLLCSHQIYLYF